MMVNYIEIDMQSVDVGHYVEIHMDIVHVAGFMLLNYGEITSFF